MSRKNIGSVVPKVDGFKNFCRIIQSPVTEKLNNSAVTKLSKKQAIFKKPGVKYWLKGDVCMVSTLSSRKTEARCAACNNGPRVRYRLMNTTINTITPIAMRKPKSERRIVKNML